MTIVRAKAPLRIGFAGGGTDVSPYSDQYGGYVLNAAIDMYAHCTIASREDGRIVFRAADLGVEDCIDGCQDVSLNQGLVLHRAVYRRVSRSYRPDEQLAVTVTTYSDAPPGSGLGSSSTMVVAMVAAYREYLSLPLGEYDLAHLAFQIERSDAGLAGGKQDQYSATFGGFNFMEFYANDRVIVNPLRVRPEITNELNARLILYYTGQSRESARIISEQMDNVSGGVAASIEAMHEVKKNAIEMKESLLKADYEGFADCLGRSWAAKKKMAEAISNSEIDRIYNAAISSGAVAGKLSGAGGGGFMVFACDPVQRLSVIRELEAFGGRVMDFDFSGEGATSWRV